MMQRGQNQISQLLAARINTVRRGPRASAPFLAVSHSSTVDIDRSIESNPVYEPASGKIHNLLTRLRDLLNAATQRPRHDSTGRSMLQACIDKSVDAVEALLADNHADDSRLFGELRALDFFALRTGGCHNLSKNRLSNVRDTIDKCIRLFSAFPLSEEGDEAAQENHAASYNAVIDADFTNQISKLTQLDILAQTCNQFRSPSKSSFSSVLEIIPAE